MTSFNLSDIVGHGLEVPKKIPVIKVSDSKNIFTYTFEYFLGMQNKEFTWKEGYQGVCDWLENNNNKGLLLLGACSLGKTFMARYVLPAILLKYSNRVLKSYDLNRDDIDNILSKKICCLDDIGTEDVRNEYGTKRMAFSEIVDNAEKNGNLLIITTNLTGDEIKARYGLRVYERLLAITNQIAIKGSSERG